MTPITLEVEDRIDHVLEHTRAGERALLGHMPDEEAGRSGLLRERDEAARRLAHLPDAPRCRRELGAEDSLDGIDYDQPGPALADHGDNRFERGFTEHMHRSVVNPQALRPHANLLR